MKPGMQVGPYVLGRELGRGGMGAVFEARHHTIPRPVALKLLKASRMADPKARQRFEVEARSTAQLDHPGIVRLFDFGFAGGLTYAALELVSGESLADRLRRGPVPARRAAEVIAAAARAMDYAHGRGVIHRDLKPDNILLTEDGQAKVTDFGLGRVLDADSRLTRTAEFVGTLAYASPEQLKRDHGAVGPASDVFSLGATLHALLTGRPPMGGVSQLGASDVDPRLVQICEQCLREAPEDRPGSAGALAEALDDWLEGPRERPRRSAAPRALVGVALLLAGVGAAVAIVDSGSDFTDRAQQAAPLRDEPSADAGGQPAAPADSNSDSASLPKEEREASDSLPKEEREASDSESESLPREASDSGSASASEPALWTWRRVPTDAAPSPRIGTRLVSHPTHGVLLYAGRAVVDGRPAGELLGDLWSWNGQVWTQLDVGGPGRARHGLACDTRTNVVYLGGGVDAEGGMPRPIHAWTAATGWRQTRSVLPTARRDPVFFYRVRKGRLFAWGGTDARGTPLPRELDILRMGMWKSPRMSGARADVVAVNPKDGAVVTVAKPGPAAPLLLHRFDLGKWGFYPNGDPLPTPFELQAATWAAGRWVFYGATDGGEPYCVVSAGPWREVSPQVPAAEEVRLCHDAERKVAVLYLPALQQLWELQLP